MAKILNRAILIGGEKRVVGTPSVTVVDLDKVSQVSRAYGATVPSDGDAGYAAGCIFWKNTGGSTGSTVYINEGSSSSADFNAVSGGGGSISNFSLDDAYNDGANIAVDAGAVTFTGTHTSNNVSAITGNTSASLIDLTQAGAGKDIDGTSSTWSVSKAGAAVFNSSVTTAAVVGYGSGANANFTLDAKGTGTISLGATSTGAITLTRATTCGSTLTVTGGADADAFIITAGDILVSDGHLSMVQPDNESSIDITAAGSSSANVISITADGLTSGSAIYVDSDNGASFSGQGGYLHFYNGTSTDLFVGRYGAMTISGNAAGTDSLVLTAGDLTMTSGHLVMTAGDLTMTLGDLTVTAGNIVNTLGDLTLTAGDFTMTVGDASLADGSLTIVDADNAASLSVTNDTATSASVVVIAGSGVHTGTTSTSFMTITPSGMVAGTAIYVPLAAMTSGTGLQMVGNALTSGQIVEITSSATAIATTGRLFSSVHSGATGTTAVLNEFSSAATDETTVLRVTASGALAAGVGLDLSMAALTTGTALDIGGMAALTTGNGIVVAASGTTQTTGILLSLASAGTAITGAGRMIYSNHTGVTGTSAILNEFASAAGDETVIAKVTASGALAAGKALQISVAAMTTGTALHINATEATITSGKYIDCYDGAASDFSVSKYGATVIAGNAVGTAALTITAGDVVITDGTLIHKKKTEAVTAANVITAAESGTVYFLNSATEFASTLPAPAAGLHYKFIVKAAPSGASYTIVTNGGANVIQGSATVDGAAVPAVDEDTITLTDGAAAVGDWVEVVSDGTNWYVSGQGVAATAIAFTAA